VISIAVIEDNRLVREGISALLSGTQDIEVVGAEANCDLEVIKRLNPQVLLLDLGLRNGDSLRLTLKIREELPDARVIVMDLLPVHEELVEFVNAGVSGFIMKDATLDDLVYTIREVARGAHILPQQMTGTLFSQIAREALAKDAPLALDAVKMTPREREIVNLIAQGLANKEIAARLHIAPHTVKSHVRNVMEKLALHTRLQIAAYAHRGE
jgi:two-component system NarL family response regulator